MANVKKNNKAMPAASKKTLGIPDPNAATAAEATAGDSQDKAQGQVPDGADVEKSQDSKVDTGDKANTVRAEGDSPHAKSLKEHGVLYVTSDGFAIAQKADALNYAAVKLQNQDVEEVRYEK
jgi:hypothetical protein